MDPESGAASSGTFISLSEQEQRLFSGLHSLCQADPSGTLSSSKVAELFKASQLPPEALHKVTELCGAKRLGYFGTPQFFVALKLLAAAQSSLPLHLDSLTANLPLPRFVGLKNEPEMRFSAVPPSGDAQGAQCGPGPGPGPGPGSWTPADRSTFRHPEVEKKEPWSPPPSPCSSPPRSPPAYRGYAFVNAKQRNNESQSVYESKPPSRPMVQLDQHSSPSLYRTRTSVDHPAPARASSLERLDQPGVVDYPEDDPWRITEEQLDYYTNQFKSLQPDLGALILGTIAKNFFTKSKLPIPELSHIWELSDVDRDGALTFSEFCTAFHLIVARKNGYPLPECLPATLRPDTPESAEPLIVFEEADLRPALTDRSVGERLQPSLSATKQESDAGVAVKRTTLQFGAFPERPEPPQDLDPHTRTRTRPRSYSSTSIEDAMKKAEEPPTPPPRPQKSHSRASSLDLNKLFQQSAPGLKSGWLPPPPALPPRPPASQVPHFNVSEKTPQNKVQQPNFADFSHFREEEESSVKPEDRDPRSRFDPSTEDPSDASKQVRPADSVQTGSVSLLGTLLQDGVGLPHSQAPQKPVRRKYHPESQNLEAGPPPSMPFTTPTKSTHKLPSKQKREIQLAIRKNKETNAVLMRLNSELQQQLKVVHQERVTLETQLDLLRPLTST